MYHTAVVSLSLVVVYLASGLQSGVSITDTCTRLPAEDALGPALIQGKGVFRVCGREEKWDFLSTPARLEQGCFLSFVCHFCLLAYFSEFSVNEIKSQRSSGTIPQSLIFHALRQSSL